jgi:hypothetical protein
MHGEWGGMKNRKIALFFCIKKRAKIFLTNRTIIFAYFGKLGISF